MCLKFKPTLAVTIFKFTGSEIGCNLKLCNSKSTPVKKAWESEILIGILVKILDWVIGVLKASEFSKPAFRIWVYVALTKST